MRLLKFSSHGELSLTEELIENIPRYAILSHTWGADNDEVTFGDLRDGSGKSCPNPGLLLQGGRKGKSTCREVASGERQAHGWPKQHVQQAGQACALGLVWRLGYGQ